MILQCIHWMLKQMWDNILIRILYAFVPFLYLSHGYSRRSWSRTRLFRPANTLTPANMDCRKQYDKDERCLNQSSLTAFFRARRARALRSQLISVTSLHTDRKDHDFGATARQIHSSMEVHSNTASMDYGGQYDGCERTLNVTVIYHNF